MSEKNMLCKKKNDFGCGGITMVFRIYLNHWDATRNFLLSELAGLHPSSLIPVSIFLYLYRHKLFQICYGSSIIIW